MAAGLYIHVPFCRRKCPYCNFYSIAAEPELLERYTQAVCRNLRHYACAEPVDTVYFGGGTPSLLSPAQIAQILETAADCFTLSPDTEVTMEANPAAAAPEQLRRFRESGVNRLSFGVQSLSDSQLKRLGRLHTAQEAVETVCAAAAAGFDNLSCDLMLALPGQTPEELEQTIREMTRLPIVHISAYLLKIEPGTPFARQQIAAQCPDEDAAADLYLQAVEQLNAAGFAQYEISNFAKPGFESRHNCKYWHCEPYLGIGPSAHSCWNGKRFFVPSSAASFLEQPVQTVETEDGAPCTLEERLMLGLRLTEGVPAAWLAEKKRRWSATASWDSCGGPETGWHLRRRGFWCRIRYWRSWCYKKSLRKYNLPHFGAYSHRGERYEKLEWALLLGMVGAVCCSALTGTAQSYRSLEQNVLRLHILANSDSIDDQALKLKVRDKVLEQADTLFAGDAESVEDAETIAAENLETLEQTAQQLVWDEGYSYPVKAQLVEMPFDDRTYGDWVMPAGEYTALRITIGAAQGQNWWCVMYPSLCVPNACDVTADEETAEDAFGKPEQDLLRHHERYAIKLKCVEWLEKWF